MSKSNYLLRFFDKIESRYQNMLYHIHQGLEKKYDIHTSYEEINFLLKLIFSLHLNIEADEVRVGEVLQEMLKGGHLQIDDNGQFYKQLVHDFSSSITKRTSSHASIVQQYALSYPITKEILFGVTEDEKGNKKTWIQFEKHNTKTLLNLILHLIDYIKYKFTGKNIGPFGSSEHTDSNPLVLSPKPGNS